MLIPVSLMLVVVSVVLASASARYIRLARKYDDDTDEARRQYNELHQRYDLACAETVQQFGEHIERWFLAHAALGEAKAAVMAFTVPERTQHALDALRERMTMARAAQSVATTDVRHAADEALVVRAENGRLRAFLEKAILMPSDTPPDRRATILGAIQSQLEAPRAGVGSLVDAEFKRYVEQYAAATGSKLGGDA